MSDDDFEKAVRLGIGKINYYKGMSAFTGKRINKYVDENSSVYYHHIMMEAIQAVNEDVSRSMKLFGSSGKG